MTRKIATLAMLACIMLAQAQEGRRITSQIGEVTVYQQGAEVIRTTKASVPPGKSRLVFTGITETLDPFSLQVDAKGEFTILSVSWRYDFLQSREREEAIRKLEKEAQAIQHDIRKEEAFIRVLGHERQMILANQSIGGQAEGLDVDELKYAATFFRERLGNIDSNTMAAEERIALLRQRIGKLNMQLSALAPAEDGAVCEVILDVIAEKETSGNFRIRYLVSDAGWTLEYDLRVTSTNDPIRIDLKARITQNSGEDWKEAKVSLSTGDPTASHTKPEMSPWNLTAIGGYREPLGIRYDRGLQPAGAAGFREVAGTVTDAGTGQPLPFATITVDGLENTGTLSDINGRFRLANLSPDARSLTISFVGYQQLSLPIGGAHMAVQLHQSGAALVEAAAPESVREMMVLNRLSPGISAPSAQTVRTSRQRQLTRTIYTIEEPFSIPSDNKEYVLPVAGYSLEATYQFVAIPRLDQDAFLMANATGWEELNLLSGTVNLYYEGNYIGRSLLDTERTGDQLEVSLGRDDNIVVERKKLKDFSSRQLIGSMKTTEMTWEMTVRNNKDHKVSFRLEDQIPVSRDEKVSVTLEESSGAELDANFGYLSWPMELAPGETRKVLLKYAVRYPKNLSVNVF